jgi:predicted GIY-YIG superfamily endonuclease
MIDCDPRESLDPIKPSFVYLLESTHGNTYVGATVDLVRRLRQHNKEIKGGAHATGIKVAQGETWRRVCYVKGFPNWQSALQFEWRWKQLSRKLPIKIPPLERRVSALKTLLAFEKPTSKAMAYKEWACAPKVIVELEGDNALFFM